MCRYHDIIQPHVVTVEMKLDRRQLVRVMQELNLVEAHCYGKGRGGAIAIVTDEDLRSRNVLHYHPFQLLRDCSTIAPPLCRSFSAV